MRLRIGTDLVAASAQAGWPRATTTAQAERPVALGTSGVADPSAHAQAVAAVLADLGSQVSLEGARLEARIASSLLHLDVVEGDFGAHTDRQLQGIAAACVAEILGDDAAGQAVRWHLQPGDRHLLVVALAQAWIDMLQAAAAAAGLRLASVEPAFVARWNESGKATKAGQGVFVVCDAADLAIAAVAEGAIAAISVGGGVDLRIEPAGAGPRAMRAAGRDGPVVSSGFSPDGRGMAVVDDRVDRFLSARGQDPEAQSMFVMVAPERTTVAASARWSVVASPEMRP